MRLPVYSDYIPAGVIAELSPPEAMRWGVDWGHLADAIGDISYHRSRVSAPHLRSGMTWSCPAGMLEFAIKACRDNSIFVNDLREPVDGESLVFLSSHEDHSLLAGRR